MKETKTENSS